MLAKTSKTDARMSTMISMSRIRSRSRTALVISKRLSPKPLFIVFRPRSLPAPDITDPATSVAGFRPAVQRTLSEYVHTVVSYCISPRHACVNQRETHCPGTSAIGGYRLELRAEARVAARVRPQARCRREETNLPDAPLPVGDGGSSECLPRKLPLGPACVSIYVRRDHLPVDFDDLCAASDCQARQQTRWEAALYTDIHLNRHQVIFFACRTLTW
jgi:hypothetical protein